MSDVMQHSSDTTSVTLSDAAKKHLLSYLNQDTKNKGVRISVKKTGCSGLSYVVDYVFDWHENDVVTALNETYHVVIDKASYPFLKGINIDYVKQGLNSKFVFNNPNQTGQCGCGESFTVDE
jgi:iron-sulfur cluster assembly accessory protein